MSQSTLRPPAHPRETAQTRERILPRRQDAWPNATPCWIDLMVTDGAAAGQFYSRPFGRGGRGGPPEAGGYLMCKLKAHPVAGLGEFDAGTPVPVPPRGVTYFLAEDRDPSAARAGELSATIVSQPFDTSAGRIACLIGVPGEAFSLLEAQSEKREGSHVVA